jgi:hypothetical protein
MPFQNAPKRITQYNKLCLHYNLVADAVYRELRKTEAPFSPEYEPYLIAALIAFDMSRMMGSGLASKYDVAADGFAARLRKKLTQVEPYLEPIIHHSLFEVDITRYSSDIVEAYNVLAIGGEGGLHEQKKDFHVGATKILHFLNPELFMIVDSNAAKALKAMCGIPYRASTQPGYSSGLYIRSLSEARKRISNYGIERFRSLEPDTPLMRVFDKLVFAYSASW